MLRIATATIVLFAAAACNSDGTGPVGADVLTSVPQAAHPHVALKDAYGAHLTADSTMPYSPRETCGGCHDYERIANGYHFQQGRTNTLGEVVTKDDYFGDGRDYLKSAGMYGKW